MTCSHLGNGTDVPPIRPSCNHSQLQILCYIVGPKAKPLQNFIQQITQVTVVGKGKNVAAIPALRLLGYQIQALAIRGHVVCGQIYICRVKGLC